MPWPYDIVACSIGFQLLKSRNRPDASPGNPDFGGAPNPTADSMSQRSRGRIDIAIFTDPTFDDFWITCDTVRNSLFRCVS